MDDPSRTRLFESSSLESPPPDDEKEQLPQPKMTRTSNGRQHRIVPDFLRRAPRCSIFKNGSGSNMLIRNSREEARLAAQREKLQPLVEAFHVWLHAERLRQVPKSKRAGAIHAMLLRWESFTRILESGARFRWTTTRRNGH